MEETPKSGTKHGQEEEEETQDQNIEEKAFMQRIKSRTLAWMTG